MRGEPSVNERGCARLAVLVARQLRSSDVTAGAWRDPYRHRDAGSDADGYFSLL